MAARRAFRRRAPAPAAEPAPWQRRSPPSPPLASLGAIPAVPAVQRQCDTCEAEREEKEGLPVQPRLKVGAADDRFEREADSVADSVMRMPARAGRPAPISPLSADDERLSRKVSNEGGEAGGDFGEALGRSGGGAPLAPEARGFLEPRFGRDLGHVRVHADSGAGALAESIGALAFTHGSDIYFRSGEYDPGSGEGRRLLAHEIAHTFQQGEGGGEAPAIQRAVIRYGNIDVTVDYGAVINVPTANLPARIDAAIVSYTGVPSPPQQANAIRAMDGIAQNWLLFALELLNVNAAAGRGLFRTHAVSRLVAQAPVSTYAPLPDPDNSFVHEVLRVTGWLDQALTNPLTAPTGADADALNDLYHPPPTTGSVSDPLDRPQLRRRLTAGMRILLNRRDPGNWSRVASRSLPTFRAIADLVHEEARTFFAPYAEAPIANLFSLRPRWRPSANVSDTAAVVPDDRLRRNYVRNRLGMVGGNTTPSPLFPDTNIFADCHFSARRDAAAFEAIVTEILADSTLLQIVDRLIQHTGWQDGDGAASRIGLVMEYDRGTLNECQAQWAEIKTVCHEVLHALAHPIFHNSARRTDRPLLVTEGFTEVLGTQLFNERVIPRAIADRTFKDMLEAGVTGAPCPRPSLGTIGYAAEGPDAEAIRQQVGDDNFRAAYFLGRPGLVGIR